MFEYILNIECFGANGYKELSRLGLNLVIVSGGDSAQILQKKAGFVSKILELSLNMEVIPQHGFFRRRLILRQIFGAKSRLELV